MPKYWGKQIFAYGRFPEVGQKQKTEEKEGDNNGQATHGARKPPGPNKLCISYRDILEELETEKAVYNLKFVLKQN